jgi:transaldolase/glucose-6-phosphate isomerase
MAIQNYLSTQLGPYHAPVLATLARLEAQRIIPRIWRRDHTVWKPEPAEITNRLGWLDAPEDMRGKLPGMNNLVATLNRTGYAGSLLLGMGGSSLAAEVLYKAVTASGSGMPLQLSILDSTDPGAVLDYAERLDPAHTLYVVSTKSGGTVETLSFFKFFYNRALEALGPEETGHHFIAITDPGSGVTKLAEHYRFRETFLNDPEIGGRNAALSYFGLLPATLACADADRLLIRARSVAHDCALPPADNPAAWLGTILGVLAQAGRDKMTLVTSPRIASFGDWAEQLIAESTGKEGKGILPVVGEPLGSPAAYGDDRYFVYLPLEYDTNHDAAMQTLAEAGFPVVRLPLHDVYDIGGQFFLWEMANAVAGHLLGINPFDQPNVEAAKAQARRIVSAYTEAGSLPAYPATPPNGEALRHFLKQARPGDYVAIQAYLNPTPETTTALQALRVTLRDRLKLAVTIGYGPRFLHSTGQLHKGGAGNGFFVQLTADDPRDIPIPDEAGRTEAALTFGVLKMAQAMGDLQALVENGRRVIHIHLGARIVEGVGRLAV